MAGRLPGTLTSLFLEFGGCDIGEGGARAVADRLPAS